MKILVLCDDESHPARVPREGLGALDAAEFEFDWVEDARQWSTRQMATYPLVILTKSNDVAAAEQAGWMTVARQEALAGYVRRGNGLLAIHSGTVWPAGMPVLRDLLGGAFTRHPDQCPVTVEPQAEHPLCAGSEPFTEMDEHYFVTMVDPGTEVFVTTQSEYGEQPGAWRRTEGAGRVAALTPGHNLEVWRHPSFQALVLNALRWCAKIL